MLQHLTKKVSKDEGTIFSFHSYAPFLLTHQGAGWAGDIIKHVTGLPYPPDRYGAADFTTALRGAEDAINRDAAESRRDDMIAWLQQEASLIDTPEKLHGAMERPYKDAEAFAKKHKIAPGRILLGEFGMIRQEWGNPFIMPADWRRDYISDKARMAEKHGFGWSVWGYSGAFGMVQSFGGEKLPEPMLPILP
jgi:endoglucanase